MDILKKIQNRQQDPAAAPVTIALLGDSVTQGCFEVFLSEDGTVQTAYDQRSSYGADLSALLALLYPRVTVRMLPAGLSGDTAPGGLERLERDVLAGQPDLTVVCYGLNDVCTPEESEDRYCAALEQIFLRLRAAGSEVIFLTPNVMNTYVSRRIQQPEIRQIAEDTAGRQSSGKLSRYLDAARALCRRMDVPVCDCHALWEKMRKNGVDTTDLLANRINHPTREMHWLFAAELLRTILTLS